MHSQVYSGAIVILKVLAQNAMLAISPISALSSSFPTVPNLDPVLGNRVLP